MIERHASTATDRVESSRSQIEGEACDGWMIDTALSYTRIYTHTYTYVVEKSKGEDEWVVEGADVKFDHVRRTERTMGNVFHGERQRPIHRLIAPVYGGRPPFHATFTVLFYFEGYIYIFFRFYCSSRAAKYARGRGDLLKFYTVPYLRARLCKMETARRIFLHRWMEGDRVTI